MPELSHRRVILGASRSILLAAAVTIIGAAAWWFASRPYDNTPVLVLGSGEWSYLGSQNVAGLVAVPLPIDTATCELPDATSGLSTGVLPSVLDLGPNAIHHDLLTAYVPSTSELVKMRRRPDGRWRIVARVNIRLNCEDVASSPDSSIAAFFVRAHGALLVYMYDWRHHRLHAVASTACGTTSSEYDFAWSLACGNDGDLAFCSAPYDAADGGAPATLVSGRGGLRNAGTFREVICNDVGLFGVRPAGVGEQVVPITRAQGGRDRMFTMPRTFRHGVECVACSDSGEYWVEQGYSFDKGDAEHDSLDPWWTAAAQVAIWNSDTRRMSRVYDLPVEGGLIGGFRVATVLQPP